MENDLSEYCVRSKAMPGCFQSRHCRHFRLSRLCSTAVSYTHLQDKAEGVGRVPFVYMAPDYRKQGAGVQLIGEAVSRYRRLGRKKLRLRCAAENEIAQNFYRRIGFRKIGTDSTAPVHLDLLELKMCIRDRCGNIHRGKHSFRALGPYFVCQNLWIKKQLIPNIYCI